MTLVRINGVEACLRLHEWICSDAGVQRVPDAFSREVEIIGALPDTEECIINHLRSRMRLDVIENRHRTTSLLAGMPGVASWEFVAPS